MPRDEHLPLTITGNVYGKDEYDSTSPTSRLLLVAKDGYTPEPGVEIVDELEAAGMPSLLLRTNFQPGDIRLDERLDRHGKWAVQGRHADAGYSGFVKPYIFDGKKWRNLHTQGMYPLEAGKYAAQQDKAQTFDRVTRAIEALRGRGVIWGDRGYDLAPDPS